MIRAQYHVRRVDGQIHAWDVRTLVARADGLPVEQVPLAEIAELDEPYWFDVTGDVPTCRAVLAHVRQAEAADLTFPVLLCPGGRILDGMHRVLKALDAGMESVPARRLTHLPPPDAVDTPLADLPYD